MQLVSVLFLAILFLQSGLDKVVDWRGNVTFLQSHFVDTVFKNFIPVLLFIITLIELLAGICSIIGFCSIMIGAESTVAFVGASLSSVALLMLFLGQRIAKDYQGAFSLVPYFILTLMTMFLLSI